MINMPLWLTGLIWAGFVIIAVLSWIDAVPFAVTLISMLIVGAMGMIDVIIASKKRNRIPQE